jgi:hypothetical protein
LQEVQREADRSLRITQRFLARNRQGGGRISLIVHFPGDTNIGDSFCWRDMARLAAPRIDLGIEMFPDFN